jgi:hypothetical protein
LKPYLTSNYLKDLGFSITNDLLQESPQSHKGYDQKIVKVTFEAGKSG